MRLGDYDGANECIDFLCFPMAATAIITIYFWLLNMMLVICVYIKLAREWSLKVFRRPRAKTSIIT